MRMEDKRMDEWRIARKYKKKEDKRMKELVQRKITRQERLALKREAISAAKREAIWQLFEESSKAAARNGRQLGEGSSVLGEGNSEGRKEGNSEGSSEKAARKEAMKEERKDERKAARRRHGSSEKAARRKR